MADSSRRNWSQFSLRTVLWTTLCIAIGFGAYRCGFNAGVTAGIEQRYRVGWVYAKLYQVSDLLNRSKGDSDEKADLLVKSITGEVLPKTWQQNGGGASIAYYAEKKSVVISHDQDGHERIADHLEQLRSSRFGKSPQSR